MKRMGKRVSNSAQISLTHYNHMHFPIEAHESMVQIRPESESNNLEL